MLLKPKFRVGSYVFLNIDKKKVNNSRIEILKKYHADEPDDPFNLYALATEYLQEEPLVALGYFEELLTRFPDYLGTYYHAGKLYYALGQSEKSKEVLQKGITLGLQQTKAKAVNELRNALNEILDEEL